MLFFFLFHLGYVSENIYPATIVADWKPMLTQILQINPFTYITNKNDTSMCNILYLDMVTSVFITVELRVFEHTK